MTVITPSGWEYDFWRVESKPRGGGTLVSSWGGRTRIDGDGRRSGGTASGFGNVAGIIRASELEFGRINHALFMTAGATQAVGCIPRSRAEGRAGQVTVVAPRRWACACSSR